MPLIDRFRLDDTEIYKWKCPLCTRLCPTHQSLIGHLISDHAEGKWASPKEVLNWANLIADMAEIKTVPRKQIYDKES